MQRNGKTFHIHVFEEQILLKCLCYPKQSICLLQSLSKHPTAFFTELEQTILKFVWKLNSQSKLGGKKKKAKLEASQF